MSVFGVFSVLIFPAFLLNMEIYRENLRIQSECGEIQARKTPNSALFTLCYICMQNKWMDDFGCDQTRLVMPKFGKGQKWF